MNKDLCKIVEYSNSKLKLELFFKSKWWFVAAVTPLGVSTKLIYVEPG